MKDHCWKEGVAHVLQALLVMLGPSACRIWAEAGSHVPISVHVHLSCSISSGEFAKSFTAPNGLFMLKSILKASGRNLLWYFQQVLDRKMADAEGLPYSYSTCSCC